MKNKNSILFLALAAALAVELTLPLESLAMGKKAKGAPNPAPSAAPVMGREYSLQEITRYYDTRTRGLIRPADTKIQAQPKKFRGLKFMFEQTKKWGKRLMPPTLSEEAIYSAQDAFSLDVEKFIARGRSPDLLGAKYSFYGGLQFDTELQLHERPYSYLYSWGSLFHPPIKELTLPREIYAAHLGPQDLDTRQSPYFDPEWQKNLDAATDTTLSYGNKLQLLPNKSAFTEKLRLIRESKKSLFTASLVYLCDHTTRQLVDEMAKAKKERGVDVKVIVEEITDAVDLGCTERMQRAGIDVLIMTDILKAGSFKGVMHNKIWIRDAEEAVIGGMNVLEAENNADGFNFRNRDTDVLIKTGSPMVTDLTLGYIDLWENRIRFGEGHGSLSGLKAQLQFRRNQERLGKARGRENYADWLSNPATRMNGVCRVAVQRSGADIQPIAPMIYQHINAAKINVSFNTPTMEYADKPETQSTRDWHEMLISLIRKKAGRGVHFDIISNGIGGGNGELTIMLRELQHKSDAKGHKTLARILDKLVYFTSVGAARANRVQLLDLASYDNISTYEYFNYNHSKTYIFDRLAVGVGSFNFDLFSSERSHETMMICLDKDLLQQTEDQYTLDLINSIPVTSLMGN